MPRKLPRIAKVEPVAPASLRITWKDDRRPDTIDLRGWIATGGEILALLNSASVFNTAHVADYGSSVAWAGHDDLLIDAVHLRKLADEQGPFDAAAWQATLQLSNQEAADMLGVSLSTWNSYKAGSTVPAPVAIACRAAQRTQSSCRRTIVPERRAGQGARLVDPAVDAYLMPRNKAVRRCQPVSIRLAAE